MVEGDHVPTTPNNKNKPSRPTIDTVPQQKRGRPKKHQVQHQPTSNSSHINETDINSTSNAHNANDTNNTTAEQDKKQDEEQESKLDMNDDEDDDHGEAQQYTDSDDGEQEYGTGTGAGSALSATGSGRKWRRREADKNAYISTLKEYGKEWDRLRAAVSRTSGDNPPTMKQIKSWWDNNRDSKGLQAIVDAWEEVHGEKKRTKHQQ